MASSPKTSRSFSVRNVLFIVVPAAIILALGGWYYSLRDVRDNSLHANPFRTFLRQNLMAPSKLDPGLIDGDGDLVASPPKDPAQQTDPDKLVFAVLGQDLDKEEARFADLAAHLAKVTGKKIEIAVWQESIPDQVDALRKGTLHIAAFSTGSTSTAVNKGGFVPFCVMADEKGNFGIDMQIIVPAKSPAKTPTDLKGKAISFVSPYSFSGFKAPVVILWKHFGMQPGADYSPSIEHSQAAVIKGVADGKLNAGAAASDLIKVMIGSKEIDPDSIRVVYTSKDRFPSQCFGYAHQLKPELAEKIKKGFIEFPWKGSALEKSYAAAGQTQFVPITYKKDWAPVREMEEQAGHLLDEEPAAKK